MCDKVSEIVMITLTPNAVSAARTILETASTPTDGLRIQVEAGGCSGFTYKMEIENEARDGDNVVEADGVKIFIDDLSLGFVKGMRVDFVSSLEKSGFVFENPNATTQCGCGKSFA
jgi:iron-sulfur cluster assembly protein